MNDIPGTINLPPDVWEVILARAAQIKCDPSSIASSWLQHYVLHYFGGDGSFHP